MPRSLSDEAIVLRAHNVGETDRFCVLLTKTHGRITLRAPGARKTLSRSSRGLLPLYCVALTWQEHSYGNSLLSAQCIDPHRDAWKDPHAFSCAAQGVELLLRLTEDGAELSDVYDLTKGFLSSCDHPHPPTLLYFYALKLLKLLGYLPGPQDAPAPLRAMVLCLDTTLLETAPSLDEATFAELGKFLQGLLGSQLGVSLKSPLVRLSISSGVTPTCQ